MAPPELLLRGSGVCIRDWRPDDPERFRCWLRSASTGFGLTLRREGSHWIGRVTRYWESEACRSVYVGIDIFDEAYWGRGLGTEALVLWTDYLFRSMADIVRLGLQTWSGNPGMLKSAGKAGYSLEGRLRMARPLNGRYYDGIIMGVLRTDWEDLRHGCPPSVPAGTQNPDQRDKLKQGARGAAAVARIDGTGRLGRFT